MAEVYPRLSVFVLYAM